MGSPYLPTIRLQAGLSGPLIDAGVWRIGNPTEGRIGTAKIGADDIWVDISDYVRSWSFFRGMRRGAGIDLRYEAGTLAVELNNGDRRFDPTYLAGPYGTGLTSSLQPMVRVRLVAEWAGTAYPLITTLADKWTPDYNQPTWSVTTLTATDAFKVFNVDRSALTPVGASEDSGARVNRILDGLSWPAADRVVQAGNSTLQATDLSGNALSELQLTQDSEMGEFYMSASGLAVFRNRHAILSEIRSNTAQVVFGDAGLGAGEIPYASAIVDNDDVTLANYVSITRVGGAEQVAQDAASQSQFLRKTYPRTDLIMETDSEALSYAQAVLSEHKTAELRFDAVQVNVPRATEGATVWPALLGRELGDRVTVVRRPPGGGPANSRDVWIRGIGMSSNGESWSTTFQLETATRRSFWTIGHPTLGRIGRNSIAF